MFPWFSCVPWQPVDERAGQIKGFLWRWRVLRFAIGAADL
jgi:hypothetical protein